MPPSHPARRFVPPLPTTPDGSPSPPWLGASPPVYSFGGAHSPSHPWCSCPQILSLPSSLAYPLFHKLATKGEERVAPATLLQWASAHNLCGVPEARRAFDILRQVRDGCQAHRTAGSRVARPLARCRTSPAIHQQQQGTGATSYLQRSLVSCMLSSPRR